MTLQIELDTEDFQNRLQSIRDEVVAAREATAKALDRLAQMEAWMNKIQIAKLKEATAH